MKKQEAIPYDQDVDVKQRRYPLSHVKVIDDQAWDVWHVSKGGRAREAE